MKSNEVDLVCGGCGCQMPIEAVKNSLIVITKAANVGDLSNHSLYPLRRVNTSKSKSLSRFDFEATEVFPCLLCMFDCVKWQSTRILDTILTDEDTRDARRQLPC